MEKIKIRTFEELKKFFDKKEYDEKMSVDRFVPEIYPFILVSFEEGTSCRDILRTEYVYQYEFGEE